MFADHYRWPQKSYFLSPSGVALTMAVHAAEKAWSDASIWSQIPFLWIAVVLLAFWLGQNVQLAMTPNSWLRHNWRVLWRIGSFGPIQYDNCVLDLGTNHGGAKQFIRVWYRFTVRKRKRMSLDCIRISAQQFRYDGSRIVGHPLAHVWKLVENARPLAGDDIDLTLAYISEDRSQPGVYGDKSLEGYCLASGTAHQIIIEIISKRIVQKKALFILMPADRVEWNAPGQLNTSNRFSIIDPDRPMHLHKS